VLCVTSRHISLGFWPGLVDIALWLACKTLPIRGKAEGIAAATAKEQVKSQTVALSNELF